LVRSTRVLAQLVSLNLECSGKNETLHRRGWRDNIKIRCRETDCEDVNLAKLGVTMVTNKHSSSSVSKSRLVKNKKIHYRVRKYPPMDTILSDLNPIQP
jgi:hypothetical protein